MYGAVRTIENLDTMDSYRAAKRKGTRINQKCNELLDPMKKKTDSSSEKLKGLSVEKMPKKSSWKDSMAEQEGLVLPPSSKSQTVPEEGYENIGKSKKKEDSVRPTGGIGVHPDTGERGQEREEALKAIQEITKGNGEMTPVQSFRDSALYPRGRNTCFRSGWEGLEQPSNRYDLRGRDLSWDYSDATISYEGSYLAATSGSNGDVIFTRRGKSRGGR